MGTPPVAVIQKVNHAIFKPSVHEDIEAVTAHLAAKGPNWLRTCVLLDKPSRRQVTFCADYVGFEAPDAWMIGYGLDAYGQGRALPYVAILDAPEQVSQEVEHHTQ